MLAFSHGINATVVDFAPMGYNHGVNPDELYTQGKERLEEGNGFAALRLLQQAFDAKPDHPAYGSYFAVAHAMERGLVEEALTISQRAIDKDPKRADFWLNHGRILLKAKRKPEGLAAIERAGELEPQNPEVQQMLRSLGLRRRPTLRFLPRAHPVNRFLGRVRHRFGFRR